MRFVRIDLGATLRLCSHDSCKNNPVSTYVEPSSEDGSDISQVLPRLAMLTL